MITPSKVVISPEDSIEKPEGPLRSDGYPVSMENPAEVQELRNKLRMMKLPHDDVLHTVRGQQRAIRKQRLANETLRREITEYESQIDALSREVDQHKASEELQRLQGAQKNLANRVSVMAADLAAEESRRRRLEEEVSRANSDSGGLFTQSRADADLQARRATTENRLDRALVRYNGSLAALAGLRSQIDELRKDRANFRAVMHRHAAAGEAKDREIARLISESNDAYATRDSVKMRLALLREAEKGDVTEHTKRVQILDETIENQKSSKSVPAGDRPAVASSDSQIGAQSDRPEELTLLTEQYATLTQRTLELCDIGSVQELFAQAEALERENFSLLRYAMEHGAKRTRLQEELDRLEEYQATLAADTAARERDEMNALAEMDAEMQRVDSDLTALSAEQEATDQQFTAIYREIEEMFRSLECSWDDCPDGKQLVTRANSMFCLSQIEAAVAETIQKVFDRARNECMVRDIKPSTLSHEGSLDPSGSGVGMKHAALGARSPERETAIKLPDSPLSIDELRAMLEC
jgi:chromosome segregation ATPase